MQVMGSSCHGGYPASKPAGGDSCRELRKVMLLGGVHQHTTMSNKQTTTSKAGVCEGEEEDELAVLLYKSSVIGLGKGE